jgi:hypothetical protein
MDPGQDVLLSKYVEMNARVEAARKATQEYEAVLASSVGQIHGHVNVGEKPYALSVEMISHGACDSKADAADISSSSSKCTSIYKNKQSSKGPFNLDLDRNEFDSAVQKRKRAIETFTEIGRAFTEAVGEIDCLLHLCTYFKEREREREIIFFITLLKTKNAISH